MQISRLQVIWLSLKEIHVILNTSSQSEKLILKGKHPNSQSNARNLAGKFLDALKRQSCLKLYGILTRLLHEMSFQTSNSASGVLSSEFCSCFSILVHYA